MKQFRSFIIISLVLIIFNPSYDTRAQVASMYFPETGQHLSGRFLDYWRTHGGYRQQGYPISGELQEVSPLDGRAYTTQYFERSIFEYHPENTLPNEVLLSQLGRLRYKEKYADSQPVTTTNPSSVQYFYSQTGEAISGEFINYWTSSGGLEQFGYPISSELTEVSEQDGKPYTVQYFERALFRYYPDYKYTVNEVRSIPLGRPYYEAKYGSQAAPTIKTGKSVLLSSNNKEAPLAVGHYAIWTEMKPYDQNASNQRIGIYGYDLDNHEEFKVSDLPSFFYASDGKTVVWVQETEDSAQIMAYNLETKAQSILLEIKGTHIEDLAVDGDTIYYVDANSNLLNEHRGLFARCISTGQERLIDSEGKQPVAGNGDVAWLTETYSSAGLGSNGLVTETHLHLLKADNSRVDDAFIKGDCISNSADFYTGEYSIAGNYLAFDYGAAYGSCEGFYGGVSLYSLVDGSTQNAFTQVGISLAMSDKLAAWISQPTDIEPYGSIWLYNISTQRAMVITENTIDASLLAITDNYLIFSTPTYTGSGSLFIIPISYNEE